MLPSVVPMGWDNRFVTETCSEKICSAFEYVAVPKFSVTLTPDLPRMTSAAPSRPVSRDPCMAGYLLAIDLSAGLLGVHATVAPDVDVADADANLTPLDVVTVHTNWPRMACSEGAASCGLNPARSD